MITRKKLYAILAEEDDAKREELLAALPQKELDALSKEAQKLHEEAEKLRKEGRNLFLKG